MDRLTATTRLDERARELMAKNGRSYAENFSIAQREMPAESRIYHTGDGPTMRMPEKVKPNATAADKVHHFALERQTLGLAKDYQQGVEQCKFLDPNLWAEYNGGR